jgi:hypothetical protein
VRGKERGSGNEFQYSVGVRVDEQSCARKGVV